MILQLFNIHTKALIQRLMLMHLLVLGLSLYDESSLLVFSLVHLDALLIIAIMYLHQDYKAPLKLKNYLGPILKTLVKTIPILVGLYFIIPNSLKLASQYQASSGGQIGLAHSIEPGTVDKIAQSKRISFSATLLESSPLPAEKLYWRAIVLESGNGLTWKKINTKPSRLKRSQSLNNRSDNSIHYQLELSPELVPFVPTLDYFRGIYGKRNNSLYINELGQLQQITSMHPKSSTYVSSLNPSKTTNLGSSKRIKFKFNKEAEVVAFISKIKNSAPDAMSFYKQLIKHFTDYSFEYSLSPGRITSLSDFLFKYRRGFCEHYAAATASLMNQAGFPTRVISGFQGGEWNPYERKIEVGTSDAHAWVELWDEGQKKWLRKDPIADFSPTRTQLGGQRYFSFLSSPIAKTIFTESQINWLWNTYQSSKFQITFLWKKAKGKLKYLHEQESYQIGMLILIASSLLSLLYFSYQKYRRSVVYLHKQLDRKFEAYFAKVAKTYQLTQHHKKFKTIMLKQLNLKIEDQEERKKHREFILLWLDLRYGYSYSKDKWLRLVTLEKSL